MSTSEAGLQPGDPVRVTGQGADGPIDLSGTIEWFDNEGAADGQAAAAGDSDAMARMLARMDEQAPGIAELLMSGSAPPDAGSTTTFCPATDPSFAAGYDAIFGPDHDPWGKNKKKPKPDGS